MFDDVAVRVDVFESLGGGGDFVFAYAADAEEDLALEVGGGDDVDVSEADGADAGGGEVEADGATETACADAEDLGVEEFFLSFHADLGEDEMAFVAVDLLGVELGYGGFGGCGHICLT